MKITYPDFQIDINVEEVIALMKYHEENQPKMVIDGRALYREPLLPFDPDELRKNRDKLLKSMFGDLSHSESDQVSDQVSDQDGDQAQDPLQSVDFEQPESEPKKSTRLKKPKKTMKPTDNEPPKKKSSGNSKAVQVLFENGWKTYNTLSQAAEAIGTKLNHLSHALLNNKTCNGHQVRYADDSKEQTETTNEEPTELP